MGTITIEANTVNNTGIAETSSRYGDALGAHVSSAGEEEEETYDEMVAAAEAEVMREQRAAVVVDERYFYDDEDGGDDGDGELALAGQATPDANASCRQIPVLVADESYV